MGVKVILSERVLNIPSSVYKPPSWIRKTLEGWGEYKTTDKGVGVRQIGAKHSKEINHHYTAG